MTRPLCVVVGVGPGNGASFARTFDDKGYQVVLLARNYSFLNELASELNNAKSYVCDVTDVEQIQSVFDAIHSDLGTVDTLVYNAGSGVFKDVESTTVEEFTSSWEINARGCFMISQQVIPKMIEAKKGSIVVIGATASLRGGAFTTAFASAKAAQRSLAQSMARHLGPKGIHVSYVIIDGVIDLKRTRERMPDKPDEFFLNPMDVAKSVYNLTQQSKSAWTFELDLRPSIEKW